MQIDSREILFIRNNAPKGFLRCLADNTGFSYSQVRVELYSLKNDYQDKIVDEARRLLEAMTGLVYHADSQEA